ncbi:gliding motility-associated C-terminal domain-containing protein [Catalinimonas alkaloidigena]|uniref:Gliding motility-associated C-terminal domain-containing protein n=1 Tax=Catalinimonas alkaloidigena TaxID=1075417 RepID=A0A1G9PLP4_9BACT|nr:gliding motility-associated C-terminal domain-containing protein [Catalinimonas alkaloidigena]SDL99710.1 gliding motility-associated C-terminal domain-containing protein [Catalinimonas alkaloidigena]
MKHRYHLLFLCLLCLTFTVHVQATHIVGGELRLTHLEGAKYELSMFLYFDDFYGNPGAEDAAVDVGIYSKATHQLVDRVTLKRDESKQVVYVNPVCVRSDLRTRQIRYTERLQLSPSKYNDPAGYYVSWERCCRNTHIVNLFLPGGTGMTFYMEFPAVYDKPQHRDVVNSSPEFAIPYGEYACVGEYFSFDFSATDPDGDELRYRMATPKWGHTDQFYPFLSEPQPAPYRPVQWEQGYDSAAAILGRPTLAIDSLTGRMQVSPSQPGLYLYSIICEEYRDGQFIGLVQRDFQLLVLDCPRNDAPLMQLSTASREKGGAGPLYRPGDTLDIFPWQSPCFDVFLTDNDFLERVTVTAEAVNFEPVTSLTSQSSFLLTGAGDTATFQVCGPDCNNPRGIYQVNLYAADDGCPLPKVDTLTLYFRLSAEENQAPVLAVDAPEYGERTLLRYIGDEIVFRLDGTDADQNRLVLSGRGIGFSFEDYGMQFTPVEGQGAVSTEFRWQPDCSLLLGERREFEMVFTLQDDPCFVRAIDTLRVHLMLSDRISEVANFEPPNVFSPNGDGRNDAYTIPTLPIDNCISQFSFMEVYNRWGKLVYRTESRDIRWDGAELPAGVYFYFIRFTDQAYRGSITLLR